jgi:hypothetical protein
LPQELPLPYTASASAHGQKILLWPYKYIDTFSNIPFLTSFWVEISLMKKAAILFSLSLLIAFGGCKKDNAIRQTQYTIIPQNNSGITGTVTFIEQASVRQTQVAIEVNNTTGYDYVAHIHAGTPALYHGAVYIFDPMYAANGHLSFKQSIPLAYDSALVFNGTFVLHDSTANNVLGLCGIGINK